MRPKRPNSRERRGVVALRVDRLGQRRVVAHAVAVGIAQRAAHGDLAAGGSLARAGAPAAHRVWCSLRHGRAFYDGSGSRSRRRGGPVAARLPLGRLVRVADPSREGPAWWVLGASALAAFVLHLPFLTTPLSVDEGGYGYVAHWWASAADLYGDVWVDRPQGLLLLYRSARGAARLGAPRHPPHGGAVVVRDRGRHRPRRSRASPAAVRAPPRRCSAACSRAHP